MVVWFLEGILLGDIINKIVFGGYVVVGQDRNFVNKLFFFRKNDDVIKIKLILYQLQKLVFDNFIFDFVGVVLFLGVVIRIILIFVIVFEVIG